MRTRNENFLFRFVLSFNFLPQLTSLKKFSYSYETESCILVQFDSIGTWRNIETLCSWMNFIPSIVWARQLASSKAITGSHLFKAYFCIFFLLLEIDKLHSTQPITYHKQVIVEWIILITQIILTGYQTRTCELRVVSSWIIDIESLHNSSVTS